MIRHELNNFVAYIINIFHFLHIFKLRSCCTRFGYYLYIFYKVEYLILYIYNVAFVYLYQESQVNGNESMKAMPAPPQEETVKKEKLIK